MYFVYILKSVKNNRYYIGSTNDIKRRLVEHNNGAGGKFTKLNGPWKLICFKIFDGVNEAGETEKKIKSYKSGNAFRKIINGEVPEWLKGAPC